MSRENHQDIRIGTIVPYGKVENYLPQVVPHGFECFQLNNWKEVTDANIPETAKKVKDILGDQAVISSVGIYGNPLIDEVTVNGWRTLITNAHHFGCNVVCGFAGALEDRPVDESMPRFKEVFGELTKLAEMHNVKIAFENCDMQGTWDRPKWNIAHSPRAWEMMFHEVQSDNIGLEWEPCHQMVSLIDPLPNLREWIGKVFHIHGKDATINWAGIKKEGMRSGVQHIWHRTPGFGDTNWTDVISILRQNNWKGCLDIEGWHDPVYKDDLEMTGQVHALRHLQACRGGTYIVNPEE